MEKINLIFIDSHLLKMDKIEEILSFIVNHRSDKSEKIVCVCDQPLFLDSKIVKNYLSEVLIEDDCFEIYLDILNKYQYKSSSCYIMHQNTELLKTLKKAGFHTIYIGNRANNADYMFKDLEQLISRHNQKEKKDNLIKLIGILFIFTGLILLFYIDTLDLHIYLYFSILLILIGIFIFVYYTIGKDKFKFIDLIIDIVENFV